MAKKTKTAKEEFPIETIKITDHSCIKISAFIYEGDEELENVHINIRKFYRTKNDKTWKPARQGITVPMELAKKFRAKMKTICEAAVDLEGVEVLQKRGRGDE